MNPIEILYALWEMAVRLAAPRLEAPVVLALFVATILTVCMSYGAIAYAVTFGV